MLFAFLIFAPTIAFVPHYANILLVFKVIPKRLKLKISSNLIVLLLIVLLSEINIIARHLFIDSTTSEYVPYSILIILTFFVAKNLNSDHLRYLVYLILFEIFIGWIEFGLHKHTILSALYNFDFGQSEFGKGGLMYYSRVYGLSQNSSSFAYKVFGALLITYSLPMKKARRNIIYAILLSGILISFNRTVIGALLVFILISQMPVLIRSLKRMVVFFKLRPYLIFVIVLGLVLVFTIFLNYTSIINQMNRGMTSVDTSSREISYSYFLAFIKNNFWFGNMSVKLWYNHEGTLFHAHNSFVETLASNGIFIFLLYMFFVLKNLNRYNAKFVMPILVLSVLQYGIFWGISFLDIVFQYFLLRVNKANESSL